jgi:hypothetical protein
MTNTYYVSVVRPEKPNDPRLLAGPYTTHAEALAALPDAKSIALDLDYRSAFYAFGTLRIEGYVKPGILNQLGKM